MARLIDAENYRNLFNEEFKKTMELIRKGETHLDTLAEGFTEADRVIRALPTIDPVTAAAEALGMSPDRLRELAQAEKEGRLVVLPCSIGDPVFMGTGRYKITGYEEDVCDGFYIGRDGVLQVKAQNYNGNHGTYGVIGQTAELTREAAEAALEAQRGENNA